jgi:hypothetical protein
MRYRVYILNNSPIEFFAVDFRVSGHKRLKIYLTRDASYPGGEQCIDLYLPDEITLITDDHGRKVYIK